MTAFVRTLVAEDGVAKVRSDALGDNTGQYGTDSIGGLVKLAAGAYVPVTAGDDVAGQVSSVETFKVNDGFSFGAVKMSHRIKVKLGLVADTTAVVVGDLVVADDQPALVAGKVNGVGTVKAGTPAIHKWQVIWLSGAGAQGDDAILEKV